MKNIYLHGKIKYFYWAVMLAAAVMLFGCPNKVTVKPETHTVAFNVVGNTGGKLTATVDGNNFTGGEVEQGKTIVFTAKPDTGYEVNEWTGVAADKDNKNTATLTVDADKTVTVKFKKIENPPPIVPNGKEYNVGGVKFTMISIDAVTDQTLGDDSQAYNPPHKVTLTAYKIGETEVTQELFEKVMGANPSVFKDSPAEGEEQKNRPVERTNWYHAIAFCNKLSIELELEPCYTVPGIDFKTIQFADIPTKENQKWNKVQIDMNKNGFRLPTEAEWEWAAKGGAENNKWAGTNSEDELKNYAWYVKNSGNKTHEVKKKLPNGYGLYDMSGNVKEWCSDWYVKDKPAFGNDPITLTITGRALRPNRGGTWGDNANMTAQAYRQLHNTANASHADTNNRGLRLVCRDN